MKKVSFLASFVLTAVLVLSTALCSAQDSIQYQLVIRNSAGELVTNKQVNMRFALLKGDSVCYEETMPTKTDKYGNISVMVGTGKTTKGAMKDVPWSTMDISLKVETDVNGGENFAVLGTVPFAAAPYAMYAATAGSNANNGAPKDGEALFEVCDRDGKPVFAVYNDGIVVYVDENGNKAKRSGFVVTGRNVTKDGEANDYFAVDAEGTHVFVDDAEDSGKAPRSGFVVTGRKVAKSAPTDNETLADNRTATKAAGADMFAVTGSLTTVYVDDAEGDDKAPRSGFVVTGRKASKVDKKAIEITSSRTDIKTGMLSISNNSANDEIAEAPAAALQLTDKNIDFQNDIVIGGGVRPATIVKKTDEYTIYLSDEDKNFDPGDKNSPVEYDYRDMSGHFQFDMYAVFNCDGTREEEFCAQYNRLAAFHDDLVVPMSSDNAVLLLNSNNEETAILADAVAAVFIDYHDNWYYINVWPLKELHDFDVNFAIANYSQTTRFLGSASKHARYNITLNSSEPYAGCNLKLSASDPCKVKVTTKVGEREGEVGRDNVSVSAVYGETATIEVTEMPEGRVFDYWLVNGQRYYGSTLNLPVSDFKMTALAVFKDLSPIVWVDYKNGSDTEGNGTFAKPLYSIAKALTAIKTDSCPADVANNLIRSFRINVKTAYSVPLIIDNGFDGLAERIFVDYSPNAYADTSATPKIWVKTSVPVIVTGCKLDPGYTPTDATTILVDAEGARLTFENEEFGNYNREYGIRFATVNKGELVLNGTTVYGFIDDIGGGVLVEDGAKLTLKGNSRIYTKANSKGGGVYLKEGATLDVVSGWIEGEFTEGSTNTTGAGVYVEAGSNFYVTDNAVIIGVTLADGAYVTAVGDFTSTESPRVEPGGDPYWEERMPVVTFDSIANPEAAVVQLGNGTDPDRADEIFSRFEISSEYLLYKLCYNDVVGPKGYLVKSNMVYSTGGFTLDFGERDKSIVNYAYYRNETNDEYLYLKYNWNDNLYEYRNYYLVDGKIYRDTIYCRINGNEAATINSFHPNGPLMMNVTQQEEWNIYQTNRTEGSYGKLFAIPANNYETATENGVTYYYELQNGDNPKVYCHAERGIVRAVTDLDFFKDNFTLLWSLVEPAVSINGKGKGVNDIVSLEWAPGYAIAGLNINYPNILEKEKETNSYSDPDEIYNEQDAFDNKQSPDCYRLVYDDYIHDNNIVRKLDGIRNGFNVRAYVSDGGGKVQISTDGQNFEDFGSNRRKIGFQEQITLKAVANNGYVFSNWSDGNTNAVRTFAVQGNIDVYAEFVRTFTVHNAGELNNAIEQLTSNSIIYIDGEIKGNFTIEKEQYSDSKLSIVGIGENAKLDGQGKGTTLNITNNRTTTIKNLTITGGRDNSADHDKTGLFVKNNTTVTLENIVLTNNDNGLMIIDGTANLNNVKITDNTYYGLFSNADNTYINSGTEIKNNKPMYNVYNHKYYSDLTVNGGYVQSLLFDYDSYYSSSLTINSNATIDTIHINYYTNTKSIDIAGELVNHSSSKPIVIVINRINNYVTIDDQQLLKATDPSVNIATESKKFVLADKHYYIDEEGYIRKHTSVGDFLNQAAPSASDYPLLTISTEEELIQLATWVNGASNSAKVLNGITFQLIADIELTDAFTAPIGKGWGTSTSGKSFWGTFDGNGYTISGLNTSNYTNITSSDYPALFGNVSGTVKNLTVWGASSLGGIVGCLCGSSALIENCISNVEVNASKNDAAGIAADVRGGTIRRCINNGKITSSSGYVGGIVGDDSGPNILIEDCVNNGEIKGTSRVGGIVGSEYCSKVRNCVNTGGVTGTSNVGGIAGQYHQMDPGDNDGINNCYNKGNVQGSTLVGGIIGNAEFENNGYVQNCYNAGSVTLASGGSGPAGGVIGGFSESTGTLIIESNFYLNGTATLGIGGTVPSRVTEPTTFENNQTSLGGLRDALNNWLTKDNNKNNPGNIYKSWMIKEGGNGYPEFAE